MSFWKDFADNLKGAIIGYGVGAENLEMAGDVITGFGSDGVLNTETQVKETALDETDLALDASGWREMMAGGRWNFNRATVRKLISISRVMYLLNPLIRRAVVLQRLYVWGQGVTITAESEDVEEVILDDFFDHPANQKVIGEAFPEREAEQRNDGNTFFCFHRNRSTGACRVRLINVDLIDQIVTNPEDYNEPWFYIRQWITPSVPEMIGIPIPIDNQPVAFPDIDYEPMYRPPSIGGIRIDWDKPVMHLKTGGFSFMLFGLPELWSAMGWARGYKVILENFATVIKAHARFAMQIVNLAGKKGVAGAKSKLNTGLKSGDTGRDSNPPNNTAAWFLSSGNTAISPVKTANSTTGPDESRALRVMVAAGTDTPEHFFGDSDVGNFATSTTLDRPTELKMTDRQQFWANVILKIACKLVEWSAAAPMGKLRGAGFKMVPRTDAFSGIQYYKVVAPADSSTSVSVNFPDIIQRDVTDRVRAVVQAATLGGSPAEGVIPDRKFLFLLLMRALGEKEAEAIMEKYYPESILQGFKDPAVMADDEHLVALGKKELGDAALQQAQAAKTAANTPKPSGSPASGGSASSK